MQSQSCRGPSAACWSRGYPERVDFHSVRLAASAGATLQLGRHTLKGGAEYVDNRLDQQLWAGALFVNGDGTLVRFMQIGRGTVHHRLPSFYAQDSWQGTTGCGSTRDQRVTPIPGHPSVLEPSRKSTPGLRGQGRIYLPPLQGSDWCRSDGRFDGVYTMAVSSCSPRRHCSGA